MSEIRDEVERAIYGKIYLPLSLTFSVFSLVMALLGILVNQPLLSFPLLLASGFGVLYYRKVKAFLEPERK